MYRQFPKLEEKGLLFDSISTKREFLMSYTVTYHIINNQLSYEEKHSIAGNLIALHRLLFPKGLAFYFASKICQELEPEIDENWNYL